MTEILVLAEHVDNVIRRTTAELLTIARRLGEPSAVFFGHGIDAARDYLKEYGAEKIYVLDAPELSEYLVAPKAEALAQLVERQQPGAVLITSSAEGREIAARLAVKAGSGLITDAVDVAAGDSGPVTTQSVFAGNYAVQARVTHGTPIITVKPNAATPEPVEGAAVEETVTVTLSEAATKAKIVDSKPRGETGRPELTEASIVVPGGGRLGVVSARLPDRPDRQDRLAPALHRDRDLRRHPAPGRDADLEDDRGDQQGLRGTDLRARRLRRGRRPAQGAARRDREDQGPPLIGPPRIADLPSVPWVGGPSVLGWWGRSSAA